MKITEKVPLSLSLSLSTNEEAMLNAVQPGTFHQKSAVHTSKRTKAKQLQTTKAKLRITNSPEEYKNGEDVGESNIALSLEIPYFLLKEWHGKVADKRDPEATAPDYICVANDFILGHCVLKSQDSGQRINGKLARKVGEVRTLYRRARNGKERSELDKKI